VFFRKKQPQPTTAFELLEAHFSPTPLEGLTITERRFPQRVRPDLQKAIDALIAQPNVLSHFSGIRKQYDHAGIHFSEMVIPVYQDPVLSVPPQFEEVDIGNDERIRCLTNGLWLLKLDGRAAALMLEPPAHYARETGIRFQFATPNSPEGTCLASDLFRKLETAVQDSVCYRGKILSLEEGDRYSGVSTGIRVHRLKAVEREQVILPTATLGLLERNVIRFIEQRKQLRSLGLPTKKGLLFYGPPGTGKTHTIHYLAGSLAGHTTFIMSAEQVGLLSEYTTLARLLQPSILVMEDVDLIARERTRMNSPCEEVLLNKLLNEMDGLRTDADILFLLTTNRPEALEAALASRPGRVDQAIEFPLPDELGRNKLIRLYGSGLNLGEELISTASRKTDGVSAAFIKEFMRRAAQFMIERGGGVVEQADLDSAIEELLFAGGTLNRQLLGGGQSHQ
jgi:cell division protease FtsH